MKFNSSIDEIDEKKKKKERKTEPLIHRYSYTGQSPAGEHHSSTSYL